MSGKWRPHARHGLTKRGFRQPLHRHPLGMLSLGESLNFSKKCGSPGRQVQYFTWRNAFRGRVRNPHVILCVGEGRPRKDHSLLVLTEAHRHDVTGFNMLQSVAFFFFSGCSLYSHCEES